MSKVYRSITKPKLLLGLPSDYTLFVTVVLLTLYQFIYWIAFMWLEVIDKSAISYTLPTIGCAMWVIGAVKAKSDPEFFSVHLAKINIPAEPKKRIERYFKAITII